MENTQNHKAILSFTNGFILSCCTYESYDEAYKAMKEEYDSFYDFERDFNDESYIVSDYAYVTHTGEDIFIWKITVI